VRQYVAGDRRRCDVSNVTQARVEARELRTSLVIRVAVNRESASDASRDHDFDRVGQVSRA
jgi:hypothetical protein